MSMSSKFVYEPKADWLKTSHLQTLITKTQCQNDIELLTRSQNEPEWFWNKVLKELKWNWDTPPQKLLTGTMPWAKWALGGKISLVENCIDRHISKSKIALIFEADEPGQSKSWTFDELARASSYVAFQLLENGAQPGDRAALLMPMSLEMVASFFGILRAGLTVIPIFSGFGADAVLSRMNDAQVKFLFRQSKTTRRGKSVPVGETIEAIFPQCSHLKKVFVWDRDDFYRDAPQHEIIPSHSRDAEAEAMLLYTSGTTGKPKACVHTSFGMLATTGKELRYGFDLKLDDRFFWFTDIGWMMGPWELFGVLQAGATVTLFEGAPDYPNAGRLWDIIQKHRVTHLGISPTAIRVLKKEGDNIPGKYDLSSLRILGSTGEPWDEESWLWYFEKIGSRRCPVQNISGGTEIMGCLLIPSLLQPQKPATLGGPTFGVRAEVWSEDGKKLEEGLGHLVCLNPLPSMTKGFLNSPERYLKTYFERFGESVWYHGDWAFIDEDGLWFLRGRSDDTIKIAGKRIGPNEFESALMENKKVVEAAAVGIPHETKGECVYCFVVLKNKSDSSEATKKELHQVIVQSIGKAMAADKIFFVESLPKTRSGKILRGLIRKVVMNEIYDAASAENPASLEAIKAISLHREKSRI